MTTKTLDRPDRPDEPENPNQEAPTADQRWREYLDVATRRRPGARTKRRRSRHA